MRGGGGEGEDTIGRGGHIGILGRHDYMGERGVHGDTRERREQSGY